MLLNSLKIIISHVLKMTFHNFLFCKFYSSMERKRKKKTLRRMRKKIGKRSGFLDMLIGHKGKLDLAVKKASDGYKNQ